MQDEGKMHTFAKVDNIGTFDIMSSDDMRDLSSPPETFTGNDCIYNGEHSPITAGIGYVTVEQKLTFCDAQGHLMTDCAMMTIQNGLSAPRKILQKVYKTFK